MTVKDIVDHARVAIERFSKEGTPRRRDASRLVLFALCRDAYRLGRCDPQAPQLTAENLKTFLMRRWSAHEDEKMWREWWYALEHANE